MSLNGKGPVISLPVLRRYARSFEGADGNVPQVLQEIIESLEGTEASLEVELGANYQLAQNIEGSGATIPEALSEQILDGEAKFAALNYSGRSRDRLG